MTLGDFFRTLLRLPEMKEASTHIILPTRLAIHLVQHCSVVFNCATRLLGHENKGRVHRRSLALYLSLVYTVPPTSIGFFMQIRALFILSAFLSAFIAASSLSSDEGMWPLNMVPIEQINKTYGLHTDKPIDKPWLEHVQKSALRMSSGGSAAFVSSCGLLVTNHHVGSKALYNLSSEKKDLMKEGFYAKTLESELQCQNLYVDQLVAIQDVTTLINQHLNSKMSVSDKEKARKAAIASLIAKMEAETKLHPEVVSLYHGARHHLYLYKRYTDVRLVWAPEKCIAFFGGDEDNFEYPRYDLDVCFFRVYEDVKPLVVKDYLPWSKAGPKPGEPLFVVGHPGKTERKLTSSHLLFMKEVRLPLFLELIDEKIACLTKFGKGSDENARQAAQDIFSLRNVEKVFKATVGALRDKGIIEARVAAERELFSRLDKTPWLKLESALADSKNYYPAYHVLEGAGSRYCKLYAYAKHLVRLAEEKAKPNTLRFAEYTDSELPALELLLFSGEPIYKNQERAVLVDSLQRLIKTLGASHPLVKSILQGDGVEKYADELISSTELADVEARRRLYENPALIEKSSDPMIRLAKAVDPYARQLRRTYENEFESVQNDSYAKIMDSLFALHGESVYPDATFTLRLSVGTMKGYKQAGKTVAPWTTLGGAFALSAAKNNKEPYQLPPSWLAMEGRLHKDTPFNFVSTNDIIGGNSGSPVLNQQGEVVGVVFDGNVHAFMWNYEYDDHEARAISVHSQAVIEVLQNVYDADRLVQELSMPIRLTPKC